MNRHLRVMAFALTLAGCNHSPPAPELPYPRAEVPFFLSSLSTMYAVRGEFGGTTLVTPSSIEVRVDSAIVRRAISRVRMGTTLSLRALLVVRTPQAWRIIGRSMALTIVGNGADSQSLRPPLQFSIPKPRGFDLAKHYLSFEFAFDSHAPGEAAERATTYVCGASGMLASPAIITHTSADAC